MENLSFIIVFIVLTMVMLGFVLKNKNAKENKFRTVLYLVAFGILIGIAGISGNKSILTLSGTILYYLLLGWILALGILHVVLSDKILPWTIEKNFGTELSLTLGIAFLGAAFLLLAFHFSSYSLFVKLSLLSVLMFVVPFLFFSTYLRFINIPVKVLRLWHYPVDTHVEDPNARELESPLVIGFEFKKQAQDENMTTFRAKAPKEMVFGKLFYYFINDYNDRNPDEKIEFLDEKDKPFGWIFHFKRNKWFSSIRYIDPEETNSFNYVTENSVIVCKRVKEKQNG